MNPYIYDKFRQDMVDAVADFVSQTNYSIKEIDDSSIILTNNVFDLNFYLDGASIVATISNVNNFEKSLFEFFAEHNIENKYPFDEENKYSYQEWNRYKVKHILYILNRYLKNKIMCSKS